MSKSFLNSSRQQLHLVCLKGYLQAGSSEFLALERLWRYDNSRIIAFGKLSILILFFRVSVESTMT
jgi:hypothetical protein